MQKTLELGIACNWYGADRTRTWSHSANSLYRAIERRPDVRVHDLPIDLKGGSVFLRKLANIRYSKGRVWSVWPYTTSFAQAEHAELTRLLQDNRPVEAIIDIGEHGPLDRPHFIYQDFCFAQGVEILREGRPGPSIWDRVSIDTLQKRADYQAKTYKKVDGVFTMSRYNGQYLIDAGLVSPDRVHVVGAGLNVTTRVRSEQELQARRASTAKKILFVGRTFFEKGGDIVVDAFRMLRSVTSSQVELVIAGPRKWPLRGNVPDGVTFVGDIPREQVSALLHDSDLLVVPSRFEAFGIIFVEALGSGIPAIGRNVCAMPDAIRHGDNGYLVESDDAERLAHLMNAALEDDEMANRCIQQANSVAAHYNWDRVAADMVGVVQRYVASR